MKIFSKFQKKKDYLSYLKKLVEQNFSKFPFNASESAKNTFFVTSSKLKILIKNVLLSKENQQIHLNIFASVDQNPQ
jgi:hypothetical protein